MIGHIFSALLGGIVHVFLSTWWLFAIVLGAKFGPRFIRGILLRRGGLQ